MTLSVVVPTHEAPLPEAAARLAIGGSRAGNRRVELRPFR
jgi:hypothetical protein